MKASELIAYARARKKWWLLPIIGLCLALGYVSRTIAP